PGSSCSKGAGRGVDVSLGSSLPKSATAVRLSSSSSSSSFSSGWPVVMAAVSAAMTPSSSSFFFFRRSWSPGSSLLQGGGQRRWTCPLGSSLPKICPPRSRLSSSSSSSFSSGWPGGPGGQNSVSHSSSSPACFNPPPNEEAGGGETPGAKLEREDLLLLQLLLLHLGAGCRISVRDRRMLLAILISSFSSESVYWASWSRPSAQSARRASSSPCTAKRKRGGRGETRDRRSASDSTLAPGFPEAFRRPLNSRAMCSGLGPWRSSSTSLSRVLSNAEGPDTPWNNQRQQEVRKETGHCTVGDTLKAFTVTSLPGGVASGGPSTAPTTSTSMQRPLLPHHQLPAPVSVGGNGGANGTILKATGTARGSCSCPAASRLCQQLQAIRVHPSSNSSQTSSGSDSSPEVSHAICTATASMPANIVTTAGPTGGHMMYPSPHTVMYTSSPALTDGGLAVLNAFSQGSTAMQVSHGQAQDSGVPQVFLAGPPGTVQIPVSAVQLHPMVIGPQSSGSSSNLTELQVVNLDVMVIGPQSSGSSSNLTELQVVNLDVVHGSKAD
ncbi:LOW QUALITY PROTEIN: hypothetical protein CRUP_028581, partial [Coryphaenoides rupestris]